MKTRREAGTDLGGRTSYQKQTLVFYDVKNSVSLDGTPFCSKGMGNGPVYTPSVSAWFIS